MNQLLAERLEEIVLKKISSDQTVLPTMPEAALKCLELIKDPDFSFKDAATLVEREPVVTARALRLANSAAFAAGTKPLNLGEALARLGVKTLKSLLVEAAAQKVFVSRDPKIAEAVRGLWVHSVAVATLARDLAAIVGGTDSDGAYLAGLLHDVGKPVTAAILLDAERQVTELRGGRWITSGEWLGIMTHVHRKVGLELAQRWGLPGEVAACIRDCSEYNNSDRSSLVNPVCLANALAKEAGLGAVGADLDDARALVMIGRSLIGVEDDVLLSLTGNLKDRVSHLFDLSLAT
jgi:putative nucleotidyltransferase with HDIG domain